MTLVRTMGGRFGRNTVPAAFIYCISLGVLTTESVIYLC